MPKYDYTSGNPYVKAFNDAMGTFKDFSTFLADPDERQNIRQGAMDAINRGTVAGALGFPVDTANAALNLGKAAVGYLGNKAGVLSADQMPQLIDNPVGGSEYIGNQMQRFGMVSPNRNALAEGLAGFLPISLSASGRAPQIAKRLLQAGENMAARPTLNPQAGVLLFHGTPNGGAFPVFQKKYGGANVGGASAKAGHWFSDNPQVGNAYAGNNALLGYAKAKEFVQNQTGLTDGAFSGFNLQASKLPEVRREVAMMIEKLGSKKIADELIEGGYLSDSADHVTLLRDAAAKFKDVGRGLLGERDIATSLRQFFTDRYARHFAAIDAGGAPAVRMANVNLKNPLVVDMSTEDGAASINKHVSRAKKAGNDGVIFKQIADGGPRADHYLVFNASDIGDPFK